MSNGIIQKSSFSKCLSLMKNLDYFGVQMNFQFKNGEKYTSVFGAMVFILFFIFSVIYLTINFIYFVNREWMNLVYNEGIKDQAPKISFSNYSLAFAVGLDTGDPTVNAKLYQYIDASITAVIMIKNNGTINKTKKTVPLNKCDHAHFFNAHNQTFDVLGLQNFFCPDFGNFTVEGIYTDGSFMYFEYFTSLKPDFYNNTKEVRKLFMDYEIKSTVFFTDISISVREFYNPVTQYLNSKFLTLDWAFYKKMNFDFMKSSFASDSNILFNDESVSEYA